MHGQRKDLMMEKINHTTTKIGRQKRRIYQHPMAIRGAGAQVLSASTQRQQEDLVHAVRRKDNRGSLIILGVKVLLWSIFLMC